MTTKSFIVSSHDAPKRLDVFLKERLGDLTRSAIKNLIEDGKATVNGVRAKAGRPLKTGDVVEVDIPLPLPKGLKPEPIPLSILYEDADVIVIDKPAGLAVHPGAGRTAGTLVNALLNHTKDLSVLKDPERPGIVHRLDMDTTGVIAVAKTDRAHISLSRQFKEHTCLRKYIAVVWGAVKEDDGAIDLPIGRAAVERKKMSTRAKKTRSAATRWHVLKRYKGMTLLELRPETGRTHQLRVHLSAVNHPVVGDRLYGLKKMPTDIPKATADYIKGVKRQMLHAGTLGIMHPTTGEYMEFASGPHRDMEGLIKLLDKTC